MDTICRGPYEAHRYCDDIWVIEQEFVRSFLITGEREAMLIDTCDADADLAALVKELCPLPVFVVQTHCDADHIGASMQFETVLMHPAEFSLLRETSSLPLRPRAVREGEVLDLGTRRFEVILLPGHTPGSIALLDREHRLLFSGDSVKSDMVYMFGPGRNLDAYADSMARLYAMRAAYGDILPSHGAYPITADIIPDLAEGATRLAGGQLTGVDDGSGMPCKLYTYKNAKFYF